jgi:hypothetical protein
LRYICQQPLSIKSTILFFSVNLLLLLIIPFPAVGQDSPGRFEVGGSFTTLHNPGFSFSSNLGPGLEGDLNFGRHFALDAALDWFPSNNLFGHTVMGLFGGKAGTRTKHFGFFGKVRPGFITIDNTLRQETAVEDNSGNLISLNTRFDRLTERAIDVGGVFEYYPSQHWAFRYDLGDTVIFGEGGTFSVTGSSPVTTPLVFLSSAANHFQFSASVHYRF